jgi:hypothetical protein
VKLSPNRENLLSSGFGVSVSRESEADVTVAQPMQMLVIATKTGQSRQTGRAIGTSTHPIMLLPVGNEEIVGFFNRVARDTQA